MTANEVIALARVGELSKLSIAIKDDNTVLFGFINLGLVELYKRFPLKNDEAIVTLRDGKTIYKLDGTDPDVSMGEPFMYLLGAYEDGTDNDFSASALSLPINEEDNIYSVNSISYNSIQIPLVTTGAYISLIYVAKPTKVTTLTLDEELDLPDQMIEALLHYIGYRAHGAMDANIQTESNTHYMRFEASCNKLKELGVGIAPDDVSMNSRISMKGFV
jgi:hypothetical protein